MINIKALDNTNNSQSLLPAFAENTDITGDSFKSLMEDMKEKNNLLSSSSSSNEVDIKSYREKNSVSSYSEKNSYTSYSEKNSVSPYSKQEASSYSEKNNNSLYAKKNNRYDEDRQAYEAVENKSYNNENNNVGRKNRKEENNIEGKNVLEKKDVRNLGQSGQNNIQESNAPQEEVINVAEDYKQEEVSMKDLLLLLQTASKQASTESIGQEESENVDAGLMVEDLEISDELKQSLENILETLKNLPQEDLAELSDYLNNASSNLELLNTQSMDEASILSKLTEALMNGSDDESLDSALNVLKERIASLGQTNETADIKVEQDIEDNQELQEVVADLENGNTELDSEALSKLIDDIASLVDKAVNENESTGSVKLTLAKDILSLIKDALKEGEADTNIAEEDNVEQSADLLNMENTAEVLETDVINKNMQIINAESETEVENVKVENVLVAENQKTSLSDLKANTADVKNTTSMPEEQTEDLAENVLTADNEAEVTPDEAQLTNTSDVKEDTKQITPLKSETDVNKNINNSQKEIANVEVIENSEEVIKSLDEENMQEAETDEVLTGKESSEKITKDTAKQSDAASIKDIKKEFKTANVEVSESLRGQAQEKIDAKANTVNLTDTSKGLSNNNAQKENIFMQNKAGENFSANTQDKGNNFNYFLKSSSEANAKYETAQARDAAAPYNMKDVRDIERLVRTMQSSVSKGQSKLTVVLTPENLGKLQIQLTETGGKITAKFLSDNEQSHKLIMAQSDMMKNQLSEKGIVIDNMEFAFNDTMSKGQNSDEQGRRTAKQTQKGRNFRDNGNDLEVGTEVANKKASGIYA